MVNDATSVSLDAGALFAEHRMYGGLAFGKEKLNSALAIITLAPGVLEPVETNPAHTCPVIAAPYIVPRHEIMWQERRAKSLSSVDLSKAKRVVGVGRGLVAQDDLEMVHKLAAYWVLRWVVHDRLPKAKTGWSASVTSAFPAYC